MPSTHKTPFLNLNQWLGSDKPKRDDFNQDNINIDNNIRSHVQNTSVHISDDERKAWNNGVFIVGSYIGNSTFNRTVELGFKPRIIILFTADRTLNEYKQTFDTNNVYAAFYTPLGASLGISVTNTGFTVQNHGNNITGGSTCALNQNNKTYVYLVLR
ncbi:hypothetical protein EDD70_2614 [Hydrogenoanaerobacterium saccharovorans]|uniref:Uncharacterized protein n=1 Tax=Hydrogenoanaerobacterium saccharovorans TaxID=474960 RepID=A0A1H8DL99_9FIRM|nr:hypothetical protein [Hydrogenoanaerobacterium saccharovorans]RPF42273.1 hypothetical protein EDD70_2614 [Hydrogenoanaerobacterium saccharovorans]SEN08092.1 hypothetical protein SAMN05216180_2675 [Hydrogenoanaerobacterium saccharovorans]